MFIIGSAFIFASQSWKCIRTAKGPQSILKNIREELSGFLVDLFAGVGGVFYLVGTWIFMQIEAQP